MTDKEKQAAARQFAEEWKGKGDEKGQSQVFWMSLLRRVLGEDYPEEIISFENRVKLSHTSFIDAYISRTKVLIEQKSLEKDLRQPIPQSDGTCLTPFQQAKRYSMELPYSLRPRWVVTCNFRSFLIYDMEQPQGEPFEVLLENLERDYTKLAFLVDDGQDHIRREMEISIQAGVLVGKLYDAFREKYRDPSAEKTLHDLNVLCVRLVFCLFAEDSGLFFGDHQGFYHYMRQFAPAQMRRALIDLFQVLNTPESERDPYIDPALGRFPYVAGGLFREENIEIPLFDDALADLLLEEGSDGIDWSDISPTIFGAVFESTLNPETRRSGGMHYTSVENIHRVIDPLFMDDLNERFQTAKEEPNEKVRRKKLTELQSHLASLTFLDPACGSGNFLTETFLSLRRLENRIITELNKGQVILDFGDPIKVKISQFYGIEINDFAVTVAQTALWIAESQMMSETQAIVMSDLDFLPLRNYAHIHHGNALRTNWEEVVDKENLNFIIGNPPFIGGMMMDRAQKEDMIMIFGKENKCVGEMDYVCAWYKKAAEMMTGTSVRSAFVSTNSITQGQQVAGLWAILFETYNVHIDFAWRTFNWNSESNQKAHVHCVIVGFSIAINSSPKLIYNESGNNKVCSNINGYLVDAPNVALYNRGTPLCDVPPMNFGNMPRDGGGFILSEDEMKDLVAKEPLAQKWIHLLLGAVEFLNNKKRYCLWLVGASPAELRQCPTVMARINAVREMRLASKAASTRKFAETPTLFAQITQPEGQPFVIVPCVSSERRRYVPMGFMESSVKVTNLVQIIPNANNYHFGVLESNVHMAWMRAVCGRLKSDYRYSKDIVYNNFPWPTPTDAQKAKIVQAAQAILDARALYPDCSLADLYDEVTMPPELRRAHQQNDRAVMEAYGFPVSRDFTESDCVARLLEMYQELTQG